MRLGNHVPGVDGVGVPRSVSGCLGRSQDSSRLCWIGAHLVLARLSVHVLFGTPVACETLLFGAVDPVSDTGAKFACGSFDGFGPRLLGFLVSFLIISHVRFDFRPFCW